MRKPRNSEHTPCGSSSGSAAAIAAGMVPFTIGEQTRGSILRPASFCGVTGFKPTHDLLPMQGVLNLAKSLDTLGFFTHTPADMLELWKAIGKPIGREEQLSFGVPEPVPECDPEMANAFRQTTDRLRKAGVNIKIVDIAGELKKLVEAGDVIEAYEGARFHQARLKEFGNRLDPNIAGLVANGLKSPTARYAETQRFAAESGKRVA